PDTVTRLRFTERYECPNDGTRLPAPSPQLFSFNNPRGACPTCNGFGAVLEYDESLVVPYPERALRDGAIGPFTAPRYEAERRRCASRRSPLPTSPTCRWTGCWSGSSRSSSHRSRRRSPSTC